MLGSRSPLNSFEHASQSLSPSMMESLREVCLKDYSVLRGSGHIRADATTGSEEAKLFRLSKDQPRTICCLSLLVLPPGARKATHPNANFHQCDSSCGEQTQLKTEHNSSICSSVIENKEKFIYGLATIVCSKTMVITVKSYIP
jgi:hypothetical protein